MKAYTKDIIKTILKGFKRFFALMMISALGVCMLTGLKAGCDDLRYTADAFFDRQNLMDIMVVSTMGLTEEDVEVLSRIEGVEDVEGTYSETVFTYLEGKMKQAKVNVLSQKDINMPYLLEGEMPLRPDEILVTRDYISESGKQIGDMVFIEEDMDEDGDEDEDEKLDSEMESEADTETEAEPEVLVEVEAELEESAEEDSEEEDSEEDDLDIEIEEEKEKPNFVHTSYRIVGIVIDATDINSNEGAVAFRANSDTDFTFFVLPGAIVSDVYTAIYMTLSDTDELQCYSEEYEERIDLIVQILEAEIKEDREQIRYDEITGDALDKIEDAESEMNDKFSEAEDKIQDAIEEIEDARQEILDGEKELADAEKDITKAERALAKAQRELERAERKLAEAKAELDAAWDELEAGEVAIEEGEKALDEAEKEVEAAEEELNEAEQELLDAEAEIPGQFNTMRTVLNAEIITVKRNITQTEAEITLLEDEIKQLEDRKAVAGALWTPIQEAELVAKQAQLEQRREDLKTYNEQLDAYNQSLEDLNQQEADAYQEIENGKAEIAEGRTELENGRQEIADNRAELEKNKKELEDGRIELEKAQKEYDDGKKDIEDGWEQLEDGWAELEDVREELEDARQELEDGKLELESGEEELDQNISEYEDKKSEAEELIQDAREEIEELKMAEWYISTRTSLSGYNNIKTDAKCIEAIGNAFPIIFLTVAILISLTTISRMVEEDRGLIGTYKALGFTDGEILSKYVWYALLASVLGGILGDVLGFVVLPSIIFIIFGVMYQLPEYALSFNFLYGIGGIILFMAGIVGAAIVSCKSELTHMPASLMRPKAPKNGSRVLLERVTPIWSRLSFLNKVTVRNLFRYKKRLFMTLFGIAGCTALLIAGFTIKDTVMELMNKQYGKAYLYDSMIVAEDNDKLLEYLEESKDIRSYINPHISNVKVINEAGKEETVQIIVVPKDTTLRGYIQLFDENDDKVSLGDGDVLATINVSKLLGFKEGDFVTIQTLQLDMAEVEVTDIVMNYLGNCVYVTQNTYEELFGEFEPNAALIRLNSDESKHEAFAESLSEKDGILSANSASGFEEAADTVFRIINMVVAIVITLAAALAFVVLFTLATTNISERERELATIKVLGFFDKEVHLYVNKETLILTSIGITLGLPVGKVFGEWLMSVLDMPSIYFDSYLSPISYLYAAALAIIFAFIVNFITDRSLDKIDPVTALKSIE